MSHLQERLDEIRREKNRLDDKAQTLISFAPRTFEHLAAIRHVGRERYSVIRADGVTLGYPYVQRPAAEEALDRAARRYSKNVYLYDSRERVVLDPDGEAVNPDDSRMQPYAN